MLYLALAIGLACVGIETNQRPLEALAPALTHPSAVADASADEAGAS
jgi:hypothetical protein